jgi:glucokinase
MKGLELHDSTAAAVVIEDDGRVREHVVAGGHDLSAAAFAALDQIAGSSLGMLAVASVNPESAACAAAIKAVVNRYPGAVRQEAPIASGSAAAVAEAWIGAARGKKDVVYFAVADHTAAGILHDGVPMRGVNGRAPAVGWLALNPVEREDYRKVGCLEAEVAAAGIVRRLVWRVKAGDHSRVQDAAGGDLSAISIEHILDGARAGDGVSISVMRDTAKYLGMAAANLVAAADPQILVLGGIMASAADLLLEPVRTEITRRLPGPMMQALTIVPATLGAYAPAIGAARLAVTMT